VWYYDVTDDDTFTCHLYFFYLYKFASDTFNLLIYATNCRIVELELAHWGRGMETDS